MSTPGDCITKIGEWEETDGHELEDPDHPEFGWRWPAPPTVVESRLSGDLRAKVLANLGRPASDPVDVRLVEREIEGGWSEFTVEMDYEIEVWIHEGPQAQKVWDNGFTDVTAERALAAFLTWVTPGES